MDGLLGAWAALLPLVDRLVRDPTGRRVDEYRAAAPHLVELAHRLVADGTASALRRVSLDEALEAVGPQLR
jgi:hypothetical protein